MAVFPYLDLEPTVQVGDKTRLDATKTFLTQESGDISVFEINAGSGFIDVSADKYLDWEFSSSGTKEITCRVVTSEGSTGIRTQEIEVVTAAQDELFSSDADLRVHEPDILKWVENGRNTFLNVHRRAKGEILEYLAREGFRQWDYSQYVASDFYEPDVPKNWSRFMVLRLIFEGISNSTEDVFHEKALRYSELELKWRSTLLMRLKYPNGDSTYPGTAIDTRTCTLFRR